MKNLLLILLSLSMIPARAQVDSSRSIRVAFYNVENLFHPDDDSLKNDDAFTPEGDRYWNYYKYRNKYHRTAKAILSIGNWEAPAVVGLAEIENKQVLWDLRDCDVLRKIPYQIAHFESPDRRGIDVGALYRTDVFELLASLPQAVQIPGEPKFKTRDILYLKLLVKDSRDTLHLMYCHWPSRYGGQAQSEPNRIAAAKTVRAVYDSLQGAVAGAKVVIAGDFNDEWTNISLRDTLRAQAPGSEFGAQALVNLMAALDPATGSHRYHGEWTYLDQIIVSQSLLNESSGLRVEPEEARVVRHSFLLESAGKYPGEKPFRTFIGFKFHGGFSDHLPVYVDLSY